MMGAGGSLGRGASLGTGGSLGTDALMASLEVGLDAKEAICLFLINNERQKIPGIGKNNKASEISLDQHTDKGLIKLFRKENILVKETLWSHSLSRVISRPPWMW